MDLEAKKNYPRNVNRGAGHALMVKLTFKACIVIHWAVIQNLINQALICIYVLLNNRHLLCALHWIFYI